MIGKYKSDYYNADGMILKQKKRLDHLSSEAIKYSDEMDPIAILANGIDITILFTPTRKVKFS